MVYFDEMAGALIDEMLEEEVVYLNAMEAGYYNKEFPEGVSRKTASMM